MEKTRHSSISLGGGYGAGSFRTVVTVAKAKNKFLRKVKSRKNRKKPPPRRGCKALVEEPHKEFGDHDNSYSDSEIFSAVSARSFHHYVCFLS